MNPAVRLNNVVKTYIRGRQKLEVLHGLSLEIGQGEFVSIMGPSGSRPSSLISSAVCFPRFARDDYLSQLRYGLFNRVVAFLRLQNPYRRQDESYTRRFPSAFSGTFR